LLTFECCEVFGFSNPKCWFTVEALDDEDYDAFESPATNVIKLHSVRW
jgi:hypothetical protein